MSLPPEAAGLAPPSPLEHPAAPLVLTHYQRASSGVSLPGGTPPAGPARRRVLDWFRELAACTALVLAHRTVQAYLISAHPPYVSLFDVPSILISWHVLCIRPATCARCLPTCAKCDAYVLISCNNLSAHAVLAALRQAGAEVHTPSVQQWAEHIPAATGAARSSCDQGPGGGGLHESAELMQRASVIELQAVALEVLLHEAEHTQQTVRSVLSRADADADGLVGRSV